MNVNEFEIRVTEKDIINGKPGEGNKCPIALRLKAIGLLSPNVDPEYIRFTKDGKRYKIKTPVRIADWIEDYDYNGSNRPTRFKLKI
jgi:hypothetical protein